MSRQRILLLLALVTLLGCQLAYAAAWCHGAAPTLDNLAGSHCHGEDGDDHADERNGPGCPGHDLIPDAGHLLAVPALLPGHDYVAGACAAGSCTHAGSVHSAQSRAGPELAALCRLLI